MPKRDPKTLRQYIQDFDKYWDYEKNKGIDPDSLSVNDSTKVYTRCPICNTSVLRNVRFSWEKDENGNGHIIHCRTCGKRNDKNALVKCFPDIVKYWDYDMNEHVPEYYAVSSGKRVYVRCPECGETKHRALCDTVTRGSDGKYKLSICEDCLKIPKIKRRFRKGNRLDVCCPDIEKLWVYEENLFRPEDLPPHSREKIYVKCPECGDVLYRACHNSFDKNGDTLSVKLCHKCGINRGVKEKAMEKPISAVCTDCMDWWDYDNNELTPDEVSHRSKQDISFICPECHYKFNRKLRAFFTVHSNGSYLPVGCPSCGYAPRENPEENILKLCPEIVDWWDYEKNDRLPEEFTPGSTYFASLKCPDCGMKLFTSIKGHLGTDEDGNVFIRHKGKCRKFKAMESENNLVLKYPDVMLWWDYEKNDPHLPEEYTLFSPFKAHFKCPECGAETYSRIVDAFRLIDDVPQLFRCSYCNDIKVMPGINDLATTDEELAKEYSPNNERDIKTVRKSHYLFVKWICPKCNYEYRHLVCDRSLGDNVCPNCIEQQYITENNLVVTHKELMDKWSYVENTLMGMFPEKEFPDSNNKVWWRCPTCDYKYPLAIKKMILKQKRGHNPCPRCMGRRWTQTHYI